MIILLLYLFLDTLFLIFASCYQLINISR